MNAGQRIKEKREELGWTQEELALKLGYKSRSSVNKVENSRDLSLKLVSEYAKVLGCSATYLLGWEDDSKINETRQLNSEVATADFEINHKLSLLTKEERDDVIRYIDFLLSKHQ